MIGRYLRGLPTKTLQAILTTPMYPGKMVGPCLVGVDAITRNVDVAVDYAKQFYRGWVSLDVSAKYLPAFRLVAARGGLSMGFQFSIQFRFDGLCEKYGVDKISSAIRFKVLNILSERMMHDEPQTGAMEGVPIEA